MENHQIYLGVSDASRADANRLTGELELFLNQRITGVQLQRLREDAYAQDTGTVLVALFSTPALVQLARGIADWMRKRNVRVTLSVEGKDTIEGPPEHVERMLRTLLDNRLPKNN